MSRIAYVNGRYVPHREAAVHIEDRGYQFAYGNFHAINSGFNAATAGGHYSLNSAHVSVYDKSPGSSGTAIGSSTR